MWKQKILPQWIKYTQSISNEEVEDSSSKSSTYHEGSRRFFPNGSYIYKVTLLLSESISTTPQWISCPQISGRRFLPIHTYFSMSFHHPWWVQQSRLLCTYPLGIEHTGTIEKGRDRDKERDQGQPEVRASPKKVEKEVKKTKGVSHLEKFKARNLGGHHRDNILLLFVELACKRTLVCFLFSF